MDRRPGGNPDRGIKMQRTRRKSQISTVEIGGVSLWP